MAAFVCPSCGSDYGKSETPEGKPSLPEAGDIATCTVCGALVRFGAAGSAAVVPDAEKAELLENPKVREFHEIALAMKAAGATSMGKFAEQFLDELDAEVDRRITAFPVRHMRVPVMIALTGAFVMRLVQAAPADELEALLKTFTTAMADGASFRQDGSRIQTAISNETDSRQVH